MQCSVVISQTSVIQNQRQVQLRDTQQSTCTMSSLQVARVMIKCVAVLSGNAEDLHIQIFSDGEVILRRRRVTTKPTLEQREGDFDRIQVGGVSRQKFEPQAPKTSISM